MKEEKLEVAVTYELCPVCTKKMDGAIVMNSQLTKKAAAEVKELHGQVVGFADKMCPECQEAIGDGVYFIGIITEETTDFKNPFRSGNIVGVKREAVERMLEGYPQLDEILTKQATYIDVREMQAIGLIQ